jgi:hypothetical protein
MPTSRHHLTLIDLMATVAAAALGMIPLVWDPPPPERTCPCHPRLARRPARGDRVGPVAGGPWHTRRGSGRGG